MHVMYSPLLSLQVRRVAGQPVLHLHRRHEDQQGAVLRGGH